MCGLPCCFIADLLAVLRTVVLLLCVGCDADVRPVRVAFANK